MSDSSNESMMSSVWNAIGSKPSVKVNAQLLQRRDRFVPQDGRPVYMRYFPVIVLEVVNRGGSPTSLIRVVVNFKKENSKIIDLPNGGLLLNPKAAASHIQIDGAMLRHNITRIRLFDDHKHKYDVSGKDLTHMIRKFPGVMETIESNNALSEMSDTQFGL